MKVLFVCTGNTCRSSMAGALARKMLEEKGGEDIQISSAGIAAFSGEPASREAVEVMAELGISLHEHRAALLTPEDIREADLVLTMTSGHREYIKRLVPHSQGKIFTLADYAGDSKDIPDPIGYPLEAYRGCARRLAELVARSLEKLGRERLYPN